MKLKLIGIASALMLLASPALAKDTVRIGFVTTLTTGGAVIGKPQLAGAELAIEHLGGKMAGLDVELFPEDDGFKPDIGKQKTEKLVKQDKVNFITGYIWSHVLKASFRSALNGHTFLINANAGADEFGGKACNKDYFSTSWLNHQLPYQTGQVMNQLGIKTLYIMAPNYAAGKGNVAGIEAGFDGKIVGKDMTKWGKDAQLDFSAELAKVKASGAEALYVFYPGKAAAAFIKQFAQAGLVGKVKLFNTFTLDGLALPKLQAANIAGVVGSSNVHVWSPDMDNPQNKRFVADYRKKYGEYPSFYAFQSYDAIMLINSAVEAVKGDLGDRAGIRNALASANFKSLRGPFTFSNSHIPVQNFYLRQVVKDADGNWVNKIVSTVAKDWNDPYYAKCKM
jgi:branched-chain amino acid transport system substrate-binding protein